MANVFTNQNALHKLMLRCIIGQSKSTDMLNFSERQTVLYRKRFDSWLAIRFRLEYLMYDFRPHDLANIKYQNGFAFCIL